MNKIPDELAEQPAAVHWTTPEGLTEHAGYLDQAGENLYYVLHLPAAEPLAHVILAGPFGADRSYGYVSWVRWARFLARQGFAVMRFDYRGHGESTGRFEDMGFSGWSQDLLLAASWLTRLKGDGPLILCGIHLGALLASQAFHQGLADVLLLWSPPESGCNMLMDILRRRLVAEIASGETLPRKTRKEHVADMEAGRVVEIEGYCWTKRLWEESARFVLKHETSGTSPAGTHRPWRSVSLAPHFGPLVGNLGNVPDPTRGIMLVPLDLNLEPFFAENVEWLRGALAERETKDVAT